MKAFKQFDLKKEQRTLWSYSTVLILVCFVVLLSPAFAQEQDSIEGKPQIKIEVQKEYDEDGNIIGLDSSWCWQWNGAHVYNFNHDSLWSKLHEHYNRIMFDINSRDLFDSLKISHWNDTSSHFHNWSHLFNKDFELNSFIPDKEEMENFRKQHEELMERFREYQKEHKKLLDKYFFEHQNEDLNPEAEPKDIPRPKKDKTGEI